MGVTPLATIVVTRPALATFGVDERTFLLLRKASRERKLGPRRVEDLSVSLALSGEHCYPHRGKIESVNNQVDATSGVIQLRAEFPNPDGDLVPGMFARVRIPAGAPREALMIPAGAVRKITRAQASRGARPSVYVVNDKNVVENRSLIFGPVEEDGLREVKEGLKATDRVITQEVKDVEPGQEVKPRIAPAPAKGK